MGYLTNRGYLRDLEELREFLPLGWTFNTPCRVCFEELEDFREVSHSNQLFKEMLATGRSINQVLNGPGWVAPAAVVVREQRIAALDFALALQQETEGWRHHPWESGAYVNSMWARAAGRSDSSQAIFAYDVSEGDVEDKDRFAAEVREWELMLLPEYNGAAPHHGDCRGNGLARSIANYGWWWSTSDRAWSRYGGPLAGRKPRGKSLADKRSGEVPRRGKRCKAKWY